MSMEREELEEAAAAARDMARCTKAQFDAFIESGFSESQALGLTTQWMAALMRNVGQ